MPYTDIGQAKASDLDSATTDYSVPAKTTDAPTGQKETEYTITKWKDWYGYYKQIPELRAAIDALATWTVGKGFKSDPLTEAILTLINGWGKDTFNTILENMIRTYYIAGDAFAEIIRDEDSGILINLKPLAPDSIKIVANTKGTIERYEQISKTKAPNKELNPNKVFHLSRNRTADEMHGVSVIEALENVILMRNEAMTDWKKVLHRNVAPLWIFHLDTDDTTKIANFKTTMDNARADGENMYIPKGAVVPELVTVPQNANMSPLAWIRELNHYFFQAVRVPEIIVGSSVELTEASAKIAYLAFQQTIEEEQLFIEEEVLKQLFLEIKLEFPASLQNDLLSDKKKDGDFSASPMKFIPSDTTAGAGQ